MLPGSAPEACHASLRLHPSRLRPCWACGALTDDFLTAPPAPLDLAVSAGETETAYVGPGDGKLKLRSATGDVFVLTVPEGTLLTEVRITAQPITETTGLP